MNIVIRAQFKIGERNKNTKNQKKKFSYFVCFDSSDYYCYSAC